MLLEHTVLPVSWGGVWSNGPGMLVVVALCVLHLLRPVKSLYWDHTHFEHYDTATVTVMSSMRLRHRRHADVMPHAIDATVHVRGSDVRLRLRRNVLADVSIPVYTVSNGHCVKHYLHNEDFSRSGFYQDWETGSSVLVTRTDMYLQAFDLEGPVIINGTAYLLTPSRDLVAMHSGSRAHQLKKLMTVINFGHDVRDERTMEEKEQRALRAQVRRARRHQMIRGRRHQPSRHTQRHFARDTRHDLSGDLRHHLSNDTRQVLSRGARGEASGRARRVRRRMAVTHTVELTIVADYKIFERFLVYAKQDRERALSEMKLYYIFMTNLMDIRYASVTTLDPSLIIRVALVSLVVTDVREEAVWTEGNRQGGESVNAERALYSFRDWLRMNTHIPAADHWMLFSGYDLAESSGTSATIGIAFIGTLCTDSAVSLVEEYFTATTGAVSAHELGHSLDADHDAMYQHCSDDDSHVMSTIATFPREESRASNPWQFSPCSVDAFGAYLDTVQCALRPPPKSISTTEVGGLYLDADEQCELAMGPGSYFCRTVQGRLGHDLTCRRMYCYLPDDPGFCSSIVPQEHTVCNNNKWCERGKCVYHPDAPSTVQDCPQGDDKHYHCHTADCSIPKVKDAYCCRTCAQRLGVTVSADVTSPADMSPSPRVQHQEPLSGSTDTSTPPHFTVTTTTTTSISISSSTPTARSGGWTSVATTTAADCEDMHCQCQRHWSLFCYFLMN